jgi:cobyrinic acid a,c-diamide synthase
VKGIVIAGTHSGCGKTTLTLGLLAALKKKGLIVQAFKAGPDFIDSGLHRMITGRPSRNLDLWMCGETYVKNGFLRHSSGADLSIVEGVMGLFDGQLSTASLAAALGLPVILVVDGYGMAETAGALVRGVASEAAEKGVALKGVIFNRVASEHHFERLRASIPGTEVLGYLPRDPAFEIPQRHLGLTVMEENPIAVKGLEGLAQTILERIDTDLLCGVSGEIAAPPDREVRPAFAGNSRGDGGGLRIGVPRREGSPVIAVGYDRAFTFYYQDNLDLLEDMGARILRFSPLYDESIPEAADAVYLGGGYPELYAAPLSANTSMRRSVKDWAEAGRPLYAECGGLMYLSGGIRGFEGDYFEMAGVFPFETRMKKGRSRLGYRIAVLKEDCLVGMKGDSVRGHEFHYSEIVETQERAAGRAAIYAVRDGSDRGLPDEGYRYKNSLASYIHLHFGSNCGIAETLTKHARGAGR